MMGGYITKDSGKREEYASGMCRDTEDNKPMFDLVFPVGQKYNETMLYRLAMLMTRGAGKYGIRNWEKASSKEEAARFKRSALRHLMQWFCEEEDEDHAAAIFFNIIAYEYTKEKTKKGVCKTC